MPFQPDAIPGAIALFRQTSAPLIRSQPGFRGMLTMVNRETGHAFSVTLWETEEDHNASAISDLFMQNLALYADHMTGPFARDTFSVLRSSLTIDTDADPFLPAFGRVTTVQVRPDGFEDARADLRSLAGWDGAAERGWVGGLLLENRRLRRAVIIEIWESMAQLDQGEEPMIRFDSAARASRWLHGRPSRSTFEVIARF